MSDAGPPARGGFFFRAAAMNPRRSMILFACGALSGLGIAGYGLFTAAGTSTRSVPPEDVATVNQRPILRSDFIAQVESEAGAKFDDTTPAQRLRVLDEMIREELLVQRALELDFAETDQPTRNALVTTMTQQAAVDVTTSPPTDRQLADFYDQNRSRYSTEGTVLLRNLFLPTPDAASTGAALPIARQAAALLRAAIPIDEVKSRFHLRETERRDEDYYFAARYRLGDALFDAVRNLAAGTVSDPIPAADGVHIVVVLKNEMPVPLGFAAARAQVFTDYQAAGQARLLQATMKFLRSRAKIVIAADYARDYGP